MKYFDDAFTDPAQRIKMLNLFPKEFKKGYIAFKQGRLVPDFKGDTAGWYLLDPGSCIKFNLNGSDLPLFISTIPALIDLDETQELEKKKLQQQLLKIIIQKLPIDKNGDLVFDIDEAQELHNNAVAMLNKAIGVNVLTTFADVSVEDMADSSNETADDNVARAKGVVYDQAGVSQMLYNAEGNMAVTNSILTDEASIYQLIQQFECFLNRLLQPFNTKPKKLFFKAQILTTTIYNYKEMAKLYKEQTQIGYSKMLPQIAMGQTQRSILASAYFENDILDLVNVFIPPLSSNTINADILNRKGGNNADTKAANGQSNSQGGRPEKPDNEKSDKTIKNKQSMS